MQRVKLIDSRLEQLKCCTTAICWTVPVIAWVKRHMEWMFQNIGNVWIAKIANRAGNVIPVIYR